MLLLFGFILLSSGISRQETALVLLGSVFLLLCSISFLLVFAVSLIRYKTFSSATAIILPRKSNKNQSVSFSLSQSIPNTNIALVTTRYEVRLASADGRRISQTINPYDRNDGKNTFTVTERGAYYGQTDYLTSSDVFGLFKASYALQAEENARLLVRPELAPEAPLCTPKSGGSSNRHNIHFLKTEDLTDHRPYNPGDDPRRINWKLFGHSGALFVREGEPEPPPHSKFTILLDTSYDLHDIESARNELDKMCGITLNILTDLHSHGINTNLAYTGATCVQCNTKEAADILSYPAAIKSDLHIKTPEIYDNTGLLILAMPGSTAGKFHLEHFLHKNPDRSRKAEIWFVYSTARMGSHAAECARFFSGKGGVYARSIRI